MIVSAEMVKDMNAGKFIPIIRQSGGNFLVPRFIETKLALNFSDDEYFEIILDNLLRTIFGEEISSKPPIGPSPEFGSSNSMDRKMVARSKTDLSVEAFECLENLLLYYNKSDKNVFSRNEIGVFANLRPVTRDAVVYELVKRRFIRENEYNAKFYLQDAAMIYAREIGIV